MEDLTLSPEACNAHLLRDVIAVTSPAGETAAEARVRAGIVIEMFKGFDPVTMLESMLACQCIALRFTLMGAIRALCSANEDVKTQLRLRASVASLNRTLHQTETRFDVLRARGEARAAAEAETAARPQAAAHSEADPGPRAGAVEVPSTPPDVSVEAPSVPAVAFPPPVPPRATDFPAVSAATGRMIHPEGMPFTRARQEGALAAERLNGALAGRPSLANTV